MKNGIEKNIIIIVEILLTIVAVILIYSGVFSPRMLIKAILILVMMLIYKGMCHKIGISTGNKPLPLTRFKFISKNIDLEKKMETFMYQYKSIFEKYIWLSDIIYIILRYNPLLGMMLISCGINEKVYDVIVVINGNKDIFFKKHLKMDTTKGDGSIGVNKYYIGFKFIFIYPFVRLLLLPRKIREKILEKKSYRGLLRVRFLVYIYSIILLYYGYYDFIVLLTFYQKIFLVYIYFAIIGPILMYIDIGFNKDKELDHYAYIYPSLISSCSRHDSLSLFVYNVYGTYYNSRLYLDKVRKIKVFYTFSVFSSRFLKTNVYKTNNIFVLGPMYENSISYEERGLYEKAYGVSYFAFITMFIQGSMHYSIDKLLLIYNKGEEEFGKEYINRVYGEYLDKAILVYINKLFLAMDIRRLLGFSKNEWMYGPKNELENPYRMIFDLEEQIKGVRKLLIEKMNINIVPEKYVGISLYNKILYYSDIFELTLFRGVEIDGIYPVLELSEKGEEVLIRKLAFDAYSKNTEGDKEERRENHWDSQITPVIGYRGSYIIAEITTREEGKEYNYETLNEICKNVEVQYMEEYKKLKNKNELVSEKHINSMLKKYKVI